MRCVFAFGSWLAEPTVTESPQCLFVCSAGDVFSCCDESMDACGIPGIIDGDGSMRRDSIVPSKYEILRPLHSSPFFEG